MDTLISFFIDNFPSLQAILLGGPLGLVWAYICLSCAGYLKIKKGWKTGYTRKVFHFLIFASVAIIQWIWGLSSVCLFGGMTSLVILYALLKGSGNFLYEAMAREKDIPYQTYYIVIPYFSTLVGGIASNILFSHYAIIGYLVTGMGDAIGEPVGTRYGKHKYCVPTYSQIPSIRSYEGSFAVLITSGVAITIGLALIPDITVTCQMLLPIIGLATLSAITEALSPHGWDNASMQIVPTFLATILF